VFLYPEKYKPRQHGIRGRTQNSIALPKACEDAGVDPASMPVVLEELSFNGRAFENEFAAIAQPPHVRITWNAIASLWAFAQGAGRIARAMFEAQRAADPKDPPPELPVEGELLTGTRFIALSVGPGCSGRNRAGPGRSLVVPSALRVLHGEIERGMREFAALPDWFDILFNADLDRESGLQDPIPLDGSYYLSLHEYF
jgi:hypothetical protein